jgi:hypothetical protein
MSESSSEQHALATNRRGFVRNLALAGAAAGIVVLPNAAQGQAAGPSDIDILNFALNLEYLEAEFYSVATTGMTVDKFGVGISGTGFSGTAGATTGGSQVPFVTTTIKRVAQELAAEERYPDSLLHNTIVLLGGTPIAKPAINLGALGIGFASESSFLTLSRVFEEIGVTAYGGAAPLISNKTVLGYAARILATEAEHVGFIRALIDEHLVTTAALDSVDVIPPPTGGQYFSTNSDAITAIRTPGQVLLLAFGGAKGATSGGFFPAGVNGSLNTSATAAAITDGATFTLSPSPTTGTGGYATMTVTWGVPSPTQYVEIRIGSPTGPLFTANLSSGVMQTGNWVTDGMIFYLQDVSYPKNLSLTAANTIATAIARVN